MRFAKYHGIGNDFVMLADPEDGLVLDAGLVRALCDRRFGVGGDGVIRVAPGRDGAELFMDYVNSDGSIGEMCGNGIRCLALFAREQGLASGNELKVETRAGLRLLEIQGDRVRVDMGRPAFRPEDIPVAWGEDDALHVPIEVADEIVEATCLATGNPHAVLFVDDPAIAPVTEVGPALETHPIFPNGANVEFVRVLAPDHVEMRVWERGSGETLACGTGACAAAVAARVLHGTDEIVTVSLPGGDLEVEWTGSLDLEASIFLSGPAEKSFEGDIDLERYR